MSTDATLPPIDDCDQIGLPDDIDTLKRMIRELLTSLHQRDREVDGLRYRLDQLLRRLYGPRSEKIDPHQLLLFLESSDETEPTTDELKQESPSITPSSTITSKVGHGRKKLSADLPRVRIEHDLPEAE